MSRLITSEFDHEINSIGLKASQISILAHLACGISHPTDLSQRLALERTSLLRALKPLQKAGWIEGKTDSSSRVVHYHITEAGQDLLRRLHPFWQKAQARVTATFNDTSWEELTTTFAHASETLAAAK